MGAIFVGGAYLELLQKRYRKAHELLALIISESEQLEDAAKRAESYSKKTEKKLQELKAVQEKDDPRSFRKDVHDLGIPDLNRAAYDEHVKIVQVEENVARILNATKELQQYINDNKIVEEAIRREMRK